MADEQLLIDRRGPAAWLTINRPEKLNALRRSLIVEMTDAVRQISSEPAVRAIVIRGAGDHAFCAGGDLDEFTAFDTSQARELLHRLIDLSNAMRSAPQPVIACVNGVCIAGGNELLLHADLAIAADHATFGHRGPRVGVFPVWGGTQLLPLHVGDKVAREAVFLCEDFTAERAFAAGWINRVVPGEQLDDAVQGVCEQIARNSAAAISMAKANMNSWFDLAANSYRQGAEMMARLWEHDDTRERLARASRRELLGSR